MILIGLLISISSNKITAKEDAYNSGALRDIPGIVFDASIENWVVDRFAGNSTAGRLFYQGPAREAGGLTDVVQTLEMPDGSILIAYNPNGHCSLMVELVHVSPKGDLRVFMESYGSIEGRLENCKAGRPIWNPKEKTLYLTGPNCLRKVTEKPDGSLWVEVVAGIPGKGPKERKKPRNGPAKQATFKSFPRGIVCNKRGVFYWLESIPRSGRLRKIENGLVSTIPLKRPDSSNKYFLNLAMGGIGPWLLSLGEDDDTLYVSDYYGQDGYVVLKCDLRTGNLTRFCGINKVETKTLSPSMIKRFRRLRWETDGPALTHVGGNSGMLGNYDAFHNALWISCADPSRLRWMKLNGDGWVRTVFGARRPGIKSQKYDDNGLGIPGEQFRARYPRPLGFDSRGGVYVNNSRNKSGVWRAYNKKKANKPK